MSSNDIAVAVRGLSKSYVIAHNATKHTALTEAIAHRIRHPLQRPEKETFWALRDIEFDVKKGDVVGIIGGNGAGKSTLLKILSQITEPTTGEVRLYGRVGSLLEVGTGFHPELTGRENVYLNGAVLGMRKSEIARQFDAIVDFAEVEQFLDTPVKRYSSGMYVRLAFAVAAHLNPEILVVDEVLSVGDAQFQKKCLGKMHDVSQQDGKTVLFVSHNMQAVQSLCSSAIQIDAGRIVLAGDTKATVAGYFSHLLEGTTWKKAWLNSDRPGNDELKLCSIQAVGASNSGNYFSKEDIFIKIVFEVLGNLKTLYNLCVGFDVFDSEGVIIFRSYQTDLPENDWPELHMGENTWTCTIPACLLNAGAYYISLRVGVHNSYWIIHGDNVIRFEISLDHGVSPLWNSLDKNTRPGVIAPILPWRSESVLNGARYA